MAAGRKSFSPINQTMFLWENQGACHCLSFCIISQYKQIDIHTIIAGSVGLPLRPDKAQGILSSLKSSCHMIVPRCQS